MDIVKLDDLVTLVRGDCRHWEQWRGATVITDPPYGIAHKGNGQIFRKAAPIVGDNSQDMLTWLDIQTRDLPLCTFFSPYAVPAIKFRSVLVWSKGAHVGAGCDRATCWKRDFELIGVRGNRPLNGKRDSAVLNYRALLPPPSGTLLKSRLPLWNTW